jgi:CheY-like chemotaxis protein
MLRILLAEDLFAHRLIVSQVLARRGYSVEIAHDGREALEACAADRFDVILMDIQMPVMDGLQATSAIRALEDEGRARVPIVALTSSPPSEDPGWYRTAGMDAYLAKPVDTARLVETVERLGQADKPAGGCEPPADRGHRAPSEPTYDRAAALARLNGHVGLFLDLIRFYHEDGPRLLAQLYSALAEGEAMRARRAAHSLAGLSATFDAGRAVESALLVENLAKEGNLAGATEAFNRLEQEVLRLNQALAAERGAATGSAPE